MIFRDWVVELVSGILHPLVAALAGWIIDYFRWLSELSSTASP